LIRDLVNYIEELEQDLPPFSIEEERAWRLLNSFKSEFRREILHENRVIASREQIIASAQRQEELVKLLETASAHARNLKGSGEA
jgi:hypothetical protein